MSEKFKNVTQKNFKLIKNEFLSCDDITLKK